MLRCRIYKDVMKVRMNLIFFVLEDRRIHICLHLSLCTPEAPEEMQRSLTSRNPALGIVNYLTCTVPLAL